MRLTTRTLPFAAALILIAAPAAAGVREGVEKWRAGDHKGAVTEWLPYAARGDADALFNLGQAYRLGRGVVKNEQIAQDYYRKAAARGHGPAQEKLGIALYGQPATRAEGLRWLEQAAKNKQAKAQYVLGVAHFNGDSAPKNWPLAYAYMLRAQNAGVLQAQAALDTMNANIPVNDRLKGEEIANAMAAGSYMAPVAVAQVPPSVPPKPAVAGPLAVKTAVAAPASPKVAPSSVAGGWRVQLGAYSQRGLAVEAWTGLKASQGAIVAGVSPIYAQTGEMVRLQLGPFASREDARRLCGRLQAAGRSCFVVNG
jgi:uncharacterized protein